MTTVTLELFRTSKNENTEPLKHKQMSTRAWGLVIVALVGPGRSTNLIIIYIGRIYSYRRQIQNSLNVKFIAALQLQEPTHHLKGTHNSGSKYPSQPVMK